ncbi:MAG: hypothetical protein ABII07_04110 [Patescibacteria group bacterium]|nr:hypothetical protein [Patescibacteria group bacterium]
MSKLGLKEVALGVALAATPGLTGCAEMAARNECDRVAQETRENMYLYTTVLGLDLNSEDTNHIPDKTEDMARAACLENHGLE